MIDEHELDVDYLECCMNNYSKVKYSKLVTNLDKVLNSDDYKELLVNYKEYVLSICELFNFLNVSSPLDIAILYNNLLYDGVFSKDRWFTAQDTTKLDLLVQTWGSRVATGDAVCRHCTMLLMDIERHFGNNVEAVDIYILNKLKAHSRVLLEKKDQYEINHLVMGFKEDDETYIYDPLNCSFLAKKDFKERKHPLLISIDDNLNYHDFNLCFLVNGVNDYKTDYNQVSVYSKMDFDYIKSRLDAIDDLVNNNKKDIDYFHKDHARKIRNLAYLNQNIIDKQNNY